MPRQSVKQLREEGWVLPPLIPMLVRMIRSLHPVMILQREEELHPKTKCRDLVETPSIQSNNCVCANCLSGEHKTEDCPNAGAAEWISMLTSVRDGIEARNSMTDTRMHDV